MNGAGPVHTGQHVDISGVNVRRTLTDIRRRWQQHSVNAPFNLAEHVGNGINTMDFCITFLLLQRSRRKPPAREPPPATQVDTMVE